MAARVLVVGAGIAGLATAACFGRRGWEVDVVELKQEHTVLGVGLDTTANGARVLRDLGVLEACQAAGYGFDTITFCDAVGSPRLTLTSRLGVDGLPANLGMRRRTLHEQLLGAAHDAGAHVRLGVSVTDLDQQQDGVDVRCSDGADAGYDLVVACDGLRSATRERVFGPDVAPTYTGYGVWRVTVPRPADVVGHVMYQGDGVKAGVCPISETEMYALVVTAREELRPPREDYRELLVQHLAPFGGPVAELRQSLPAAEHIVYSPIEEVRLPAPWHRGRVVVIGDAAHACAPHLAQGASMALEDASVLAELCADGADVPGALTAFGQRRAPRVQVVQDASLGILVGEMTTDPDLLLETAVRELPARSAELQLMLATPA